MRHRQLFGLILLAILVTIGVSTPAQAATQRFAVLPITVHGPEKYQYLQQGIQSMLVSRLTWADHLTPVDKSDLGLTSADIASQDRASQVLQQHDLDILFWGDMTIVGQEASFDLQLLDANGAQQTKSVQTSLSKLVPTLEDMAQDINARIFDRPGTQPKPKKEPSAQKENENQTLNPGLQYSQNQSKANGQGLNPQFRYQSSAQDGGRLRTQSLPFAAIGMVAGDVDNNGEMEIFLLQSDAVTAYRYQERRLRPIATYEAGKRSKCLNINLLDMNRDGFQEIIVSAIQNNYERIQSFVLNLKNNELQVVHEDIDLFLNVVKEPPTYSPVLVGQKKGGTSLFGGKVHVVVSSNGQYQLGRALSLPHTANAFNFTYLPSAQGEKDLLVLADKRDHLRVYRDKDKVLYATDQAYANIGVYMKVSDSMPGLEMHYEDMKKLYYVPARMITCDLDQDETFELLVNRNISSAAEFFPRYRFYPQGEMHNLIWDGVGLNVQWKTHSIKGMIVDYDLADMTGDKGKDMLVAVNTHPGMTGMRNRQTYILIYPLQYKDKTAQ